MTLMALLILWSLPPPTNFPAPYLPIGSECDAGTRWERDRRNRCDDLAAVWSVALSQPTRSTASLRVHSPASDQSSTEDKTMFVKRSTMEAAVEAERQRGSRAVMQLAQSYGEALHRVTALQQQLAAWVMNEPGDITPRQMATMFYAQNDDWQAEFFNVMQEVVTAHHEALPAGDMAKSPGHPAGEGQWWHVAGKLNDSGFETLEAMFEHAQYQRNSKAA